MNLNVYIETFLSWHLTMRTACVFFFSVFLLGLLVGKYLLHLLSFVPFLLDKLLRGIYILIELPVNTFHRKFGGNFYDIENAIARAAEKMESLLIRWHNRWLHAKTSILLVLAIYLGTVLFTGVIPLLAGTMNAPIAKGGRLYLQLESKLIERAEDHGWYVTPEKIIQNSVFMKIDDTHILKKGQLKNLDFAPVLQDGCPYLPVRDIASALGGTVSWNSKNQQAVVRLGKNVVRLSEESSEVLLNDEKVMLLNSHSPITIDSKMYMDAQLFATLLGFYFDWLPEHNILAISSNIDFRFGPLTLQAIEEKLSPYSIPKKVVPNLRQK